MLARVGRRQVVCLAFHTRSNGLNGLGEDFIGTRVEKNFTRGCAKTQGKDNGDGRERDDEAPPCSLGTHGGQQPIGADEDDGER